MAGAEIRGTNEITLQSTDKAWTKEEGLTTEEVRSGPLDKAGEYFDDRVAEEDVSSAALLGTPGAFYAEVVTTKVDPDGTETHVKWQVRPVIVSKDLRQHAYFRTISGAVATDIIKVDRMINNSQPYDSTIITGAFEPAMARYYALRIRGVQKYQEVALSLTKLETVSRESELVAGYLDMNRVVSMSQINPPVELVGALRSIARIVGYSDLDDPDNPTFNETSFWDWVKQAPTVENAARGRWEIGSEWLGVEQASAVLFGGSWDPKES